MSDLIAAHSVFWIAVTSGGRRRLLMQLNVPPNPGTHTDIVPWAASAPSSQVGELDIRQSTGRTGSCFDNAAAESFFAVLKAEIGTTVWETRAQARQDVFRWIAEHYNRERIHSTSGYITPYQARVRCHQRLDLAA
ncbi:integrase core domain-containing protein [Streptomyces sp. NBC_00365]|uniref:integrase core domain-containing protein n=1 Tax=Streptomyces sp. NBC_00365 TaxID=2975726 RepID=UPI002252941E|nr:integrase core domain-containing protein [Streptomyces sp. NBC_00365]MCX5095733.1 integrase core domain-containing protein [Streptomyces sp. NBC_00365]